METIDIVLAQSGDPIGSIVGYIAIFWFIAYILGYTDIRDNQGNETKDY